MSIKVFNNILGMCATNTYYVFDEDSKEGFIIDPASDAQRIIDRVKKLGFAPKAILLTHGHFDHILAVEEVRDTFQIPVITGVNERAVLQSPSMNLTGVWMGSPLTIEADTYVNDGEELNLGGILVKAIETPGHTVGGMCFYLKDSGLLFSGDTLFCESVGRTDFEGGSSSKLIRGIKEKLFVLPENTRVYPGHGDDTTIENEKRYNPYCI